MWQIIHTYRLSFRALRFMQMVFVLCFIWSGISIADEKLSVYVSISPQKYLVERIGHEYVAVQVMLKPGDEPETYDPTPRQLTALAGAQLYFCIGVPFERAWAKVIHKGNPKLKLVGCDESIVGLHSHTLDNHIWTSPGNAKILATEIRKHLVEYDPLHEKQYAANYAALMSELERLDEEIRLMLDGRRTSYFIISHPSLGHYARDYGLIQLSLEKDGKGYGAKNLGEIMQTAKQENIRTVFFQKQHGAAAARAFAAELGAELIEIDPLREDFINNLHEISGLIARAVH